MSFPVRAVATPAVLHGKANGLLDGVLVDTPGQAGGVRVRLVEPAARAWRALCAAALAAGHILKAVGPADSYRPYGVQERIFRQRYTPEFLRGRPTKKWRGQDWYQRPGTAVAAVPGTSNHGWGLAVDTGEERDSDAGAESLDHPTLAWLLANEERFGWSHELQSEPWHLRYFAGDAIPQAVLDFEVSDTSEEDDHMDFIISPDGTIVALIGGKLVTIYDSASSYEDKARMDLRADDDTRNGTKTWAALVKACGQPIGA